MAGSSPNDQHKYLLFRNRNVDSTINGVFQTFQDFQNNDLWEIFCEEFEGFTKKDFRQGITIQLQKLYALLKK